MTEKRTTLRDLIVGGLLRADEELTCEPRRGEVYTARLSPDGSINYNGVSFPSPSGWAAHVAGNSRDGWRDVYSRGRPLDDFRSMLAGQSNSKTMRQRQTRSSNRDVNENVEEEATSGLITSSSDMVQTSASPSREVAEEDRFKKSLLDRLISLTPAMFEMLVVEYLKAKGFANVEATGRSGDGGIDGHFEMPFIKLKGAFQAKRYALGNNVGIEPVQRLQGSMSGMSERGILITTSNFTQAAVGWVQETAAPITLVHGNQLVTEMMGLGIGVNTVPVVKYEIDESFFTDLGA